MKFNVNRKTSQTNYLVTIICILLLLISISGLTYAWFNYNSRLNSISLIQMPSKITISGAKRDDLKRISLELGSNDTIEDDAVTIRRVFCIESTDDFLLGVAHTTNNQNMNIHIYPVLKVNSDIENAKEGTVGGTNQLENKEYFYLPDVSELTGDYVNKVTGSSVADDSKHNETYDNDDKVQINAEPLYWVTFQPLDYNDENYSFAGELVDGTPMYYRYFVLELSWDIAESETDIVYLMAGIS